MNSEAFKSSVGRCAFISKFSVLVLTLGLGLMPLGAYAKTSDVQFMQYLSDICGGIITAPPGVNWNSALLANMCSASGVVSGGGTSTTNLGAVNASSDAALRKKKRRRDSSDAEKDKSQNGASSDGGRWGVLVTPQYGGANRRDTDLGNGYKSNLTGLVIGLDYRFSDSFVLGGTFGNTKDKASFINNTDSLNTSNNSFTLYGTWLPSENTSFDGYLGYGKLNLDSQRHVIMSLINGNINGSTTGRQTMAGISASYQSGIGRFDLSPFINLDYIKTRFKGYNESGTYLFDSGSGYDIGTDNLALHFGDRSVTSLISSLGFRLGASYGYDWGTLQPSARIAAVHEFQNKTRQISNELVIAPGAPFLVETDSPDRNYLNLGLGVSAALNGGTQLFLDFDKRAQDKLLSSWAVSLGVLTEF